jgi:alpha-1,2-mannosyltransferase
MLEPMKTAGTYTTIFSVTILVFITIVIPVFQLSQEQALDLKSYYVAGHLAIQGRNVYDPGSQMAVVRQQQLGDAYYPYIYFPIVAIGFMPLATLPFNTVQWLWYILSLASLVLSMFVLYKIACKHSIQADSGYSGKTLEPFSLLFGSMLMAGLASNFINGQTNTQILLLLTLCIVALEINKDYAAGFCLGILAMIKPQPLVIVPYLFVIKRFKAAVAAIVTFTVGSLLTGVLIGWDTFMYYIHEVLPSFAMKATQFPPILINAPPNRSIQGLVMRLLTDSRWNPAVINMPDTAPLIARLSVLLIIVVTAFFLSKRLHRSLSFHQVWTDIGWLALTSVIISPLTWDHHFVLLIVFSVPMAFQLQRRPLSRAGIVMIAAWVLIAIPSFPMNTFWHNSRFGHIGLSFQTLALLVLWFVYGRYFIATSGSQTRSNHV